jgi:hypothetical protein
LYGGPVVTGAFTGDANGNLITNLSNISASLNGVAFEGSLKADYWQGGHWLGSGAVASFDGLRNNFSFGNAASYFYVIPWSNPVVSDAAQAFTPRTGYVNYYNGNYNASNWHVAAVPVPEPETYAMLLAGLGLMGFVARRRKQREVAA